VRHGTPDRLGGVNVSKGLAAPIHSKVVIALACYIATVRVGSERSSVPGDDPIADSQYRFDGSANLDSSLFDRTAYENALMLVMFCPMYGSGTRSFHAVRLSTSRVDQDLSSSPFPSETFQLQIHAVILPL
jgi:hypothetical protein